VKTYRSEVIVAGGGPAGVCAAVAAARAGARVLLVEQYGQLGGMSTMGSVLPWMTFHNMDGVQTVRGIPQEIVDRLAASGSSPGHVPDTIGETWSVTPFDPEALKVLLAKMCREAGARILFHTFLFGAQTQGNSLTALRAASKEGEVRLEADCFVDATGDADLAWFSGCRTEKGRPSDGKMQPVTMNFSMANVNFEDVRKYMVENPDEFHSRTRFELLGDLPWGVSGFFSLWERGRKEMSLDIRQERLLFFRGYRPDIAGVNTTRVLDIDGTKPEDLTCASIEGRKQAMDVARLLVRYIPGFENAYILSTGAVIGVRETRRIVGRCVLNTQDLIAGRMPGDTVAVNAYTIDVHDPDGSGFTQKRVASYGIPYRSLLVRELDNLIVAGRSISATHEAQSSVRVCPSCMAMGQAAGTAAALSIACGGSAAGVDTGELRRALIENGAWLGNEQEAEAPPV